MTALAGCVGAADSELERACRTILRAQQGYGGALTKTAALPGAHFGISLRTQLPDDQFDRQPLIEAGRFLLVADVRLDNRAELLDGLELDRPELADSKILLRAWMRWNVSCLDRLVGDYAFALWDAAEQRLILARDPTGQRPLFFALGDGAASFASMPGGVLSSPFVRSAFRLERVASAVLGITDLSEATYFDGLSRVLPGHFVVIDQSGSVQKPYWNPRLDALGGTDAEFVDAYHEQLDRAVRPALRRHNGAVGVHLSSGFDSSAVAATAARLGGNEKPIAFTSAPRLGFSGPVHRGRIADESGLAALTAEMYGLEHVIIRPEGRALDLLREHARFYQEPNRNVVNMEWWSAIHRSARAKGVSTLLTGQMGNFSIHAGGLPILAEWVRRGDWREWSREAKAAAGSGKARWRGIFINSFDAWLGPRLVRHAFHHFAGMPSEGEQSYLQAHWLPILRERSLSATRELLSASPYERRLALIRTEDIGVHRKGAIAESGIDERDPLANRRLIEFSLRLPPEQLLHRGEWRPLARRALKGHVPDAVLNADLRGYQAADWFERVSPIEARAVLEEISTNSTVASVLDLARIRRDIDRWPVSGSAELSSQAIFRARLTSALSMGVFLQEFDPLVSGSAVP